MKPLSNSRSQSTFWVVRGRSYSQMSFCSKLPFEEIWAVSSSWPPSTAREMILKRLKRMSRPLWGLYTWPWGTPEATRTANPILIMYCSVYVGSYGNSINSKGYSRLFGISKKNGNILSILMQTSERQRLRDPAVELEPKIIVIATQHDIRQELSSRY